ncbi:MAG: rRNA adenine N-6-methyltransferase family protein [Bacteroidota bacterium]
MANTFLKSIVDFTKNVKTTGALYQTSKQIEKEICSKIDQDTKVVVEFGTGLGNITQRILDQLPPDGKLYSFEVKAEFLEDVRQLIQDERLVLINDGAQNFDTYVTEKVDCFISSIPVTLIPKEVVMEALQKSYQSLKAGHYFCQVLYSPFHKKKFSAVFDEVTIETAASVPLGFVHHCRKAVSSGSR